MNTLECRTVEGAAWNGQPGMDSLEWTAWNELSTVWKGLFLKSVFPVCHCLQEY